MALIDKKKKAGEEPTSKNYATIVAPVITEKAAVVGNDGNVVVFRVAPRASKDEIKEAVERVFKVEVRSVRTANFVGKFKRTAKGQGRKPSFKKAYITLGEGQTIDVVEGM